MNDISPSIPILNAVIVFISLIGYVDGVLVNDINISVLFLNPKKLPAEKEDKYIIHNLLLFPIEA